MPKHNISKNFTKLLEDKIETNRALPDLRFSNISEIPYYLVHETGIIDLPVWMYIEIVSKFERAITICAKIESEHSSDDEKSRVDRLWECVEMQLQGVSLNPKATEATLYCVSTGAAEFRIEDLSELIDRIQRQLNIKNVIWGYYHGHQMSICLTIDTVVV